MNNSTVLLTSANYFTILKFRYCFISKLIASGHKVVLYSSDDEMSINSINKLEKLGAICIKTGNGRGSYSLVEAYKYIIGYIKILRKYPVDIVINFTLMPMIFGGTICRLKKIRYISVITGLGSQYHGNFIKSWLLKLAYSLSVKKSNQIWFVSMSDAKIGVEKLHINSNKIRIAYGAGIKINGYKSSFVKENHCLSKTQIIYMGRIRKDKGIEDFISLANKLSLDDRFSLVIMGSLDTKDKYIKSNLNQAIQDGLITQIDFNYDNLQNLRSADVLLLCSRHEGMPTVILESMANLVIPISTNLPVIDELNQMGAKIYSYESGNIESLAREILEIVNTRVDKREEILNNNHKFVSKYFDQDDIAKLQYSFLLELID